MKPLPSLIVIVAYLLAFYMLSLALRNIPVGIAYAIWSGVGMAIVAIVGIILFGEHLTIITVAGLALIIVGVILLEVNLSVVVPGSSTGSSR
jgi:small multidrug resistance pump